MYIIGNEMIVCVFYKRIVYKCTLGTPRLVTCNHCGVQLTRGSITAPKEKWHNKIMNNHLKRVHPNIMKEVCEARDNKGEKAKDPKDETVRGSIPIFNLRNRKDKDAFLSQVWHLFQKIDN